MFMLGSGSQGIVTRDGEYFMLPTDVTVEVEPAAVVTLTLGPSGQYVVTGLTITASLDAPITAATLRGLSLAKVAKDAFGRYAWKGTLNEQGTLVFDPTQRFHGVELDEITRKRPIPESRPGRRRITPELLEEVWAIVQETEARGGKVGNAVARHFGVPLTTARNWIKFAKKEHMNGGTP